jgi:ATP-binding cassette subfamily C protein CydD
MKALDSRLLTRARPVRWLLVADAGLGVISAFAVLAQAVLLAGVVSRSFHGAPLASVTGGLALLVGCVALRAAAAWGYEVAGRRAATAVLSGLRDELVERRMRRPAALDGVESAEVATTAVQGVDALEAYFARYLPQVVLAVAVPPAVLVLALVIDPIAAGIMLLTLPLVPVFMVLIGRYTERRTRQRWQALTRLSSHFLDVVRGLPTLRAFNRGPAQAAGIADAGEAYRTATMRTLRVTFLSATTLELAATLGVALVAVVVGVRLAGGSIGLTPALTVLVLAPELYAPLRGLGAQYHASADGLAVAERMAALVDDSAPITSGAVVPQSPDRAPVRLERVSFGYPARDAPVIRCADLTLMPGQTVALTGPSGSGKSTVAALLLRFAEPDSGRVTVGGVDLARCDVEAWRALVAWLPQRPTLFRGTIAANIRMGDHAAGLRELRGAAASAGADEFIERLRDGYETVVGDGGLELSAGERQRIGLARAFLRKAPLMILDEPTANLDPRSARLIRGSVERLAGTCTVLLLTHDAQLASVANAVLEIHSGGIVAAPAAAAAGWARFAGSSGWRMRRAAAARSWWSPARPRSHAALDSWPPPAISSRAPPSTRRSWS